MVAQTPMILLLVCALVCQGAAASAKPLDVWYLGSLDSGLHGIRGKVYAASGDTLVLRDFSYDGRAPGARFIIGRGNSPDGNGIVVKDGAGRFEALKAYRNQTLVLKLTAGNKITDFNWFSVYDRKAKRSFAHVDIPANLHLPRARTVATHLVGDHANATAVVIEDKNTLLVKNFYFDGSVPGTYFLVGKGNELGPSKGMRILDEKGSNSALGMYAGANLRLTLPENMTVDDIDWFAVSCTSCTRPLVHGTIPKHINVPLNTRWIKRKSRLGLLRIRAQPPPPGDFTNCETVYKDVIQVGWQLDADTITFHVRAVAALNMWTAFGLSGADDKSMMEGADVAVISIVSPNNKVTVTDYYLTAKTQCSGGGGVCPDTAQSGKDDLKVKSSTFANGIVDVVYSRKLNTGDTKDKVIKAQGQTAVVAAQGPLNQAQLDTVLYHTMVVTRDNVNLEFARATPAVNCPPLPTAQQPQPPGPGGGSNSKLLGGRDMIGVKNFTASIGPTGGSMLGYQAITGMAGWGISWWINGELIPVLHVERGQTYTFNAQGGDDVTIGAKYHPFYITDSAKGGGAKVMPPEVVGQKGNMLYAGVTIDPKVNAIDTRGGEGRFCEYISSPGTDKATTIEDFKKSVKLVCEDGAPGVFTWTPDEKTPDIVYYQCYSHYYLGWKIMVHDKGKGPPPPPPPPPPGPGPKPKPKPKPKPRPKKPKKPPTKPASDDSGDSGGSGGSGDAVRPVLPPVLFACAAVLATLLLRRHARDGHV